MSLLEHVHIVSGIRIGLNKIGFTCKREHDAAIKIMCTKICEKWTMFVRLKKKKGRKTLRKQKFYVVACPMCK